jgi:hypothetical protein
MRETNRPTKLMMTDVLQYRFRVGKIFFTSILFPDILRESLVQLNVQKQFTKAIMTPIALKENPDAHRDCDDPARRTVFANVRITALIVLRTI